MTKRAAFACVLSLLVVSSGSFVLFNGGTVAAVPDGVEDRATFTVRTGAIYPHLSEGGQICAEKIKPGVNRVIVTDATLKNVDIYLGDEGEVQTHISFPTGEVNGQLVLYTNGENLLVNTLATLGICLPPGVPNPFPTTLEAYYLGVNNLDTKNLELSSGGNAPEPSGPSLPKLLNATNTSREEIGLNNSTATNTTNTTNSTDLINGTSNSTVEEIVNQTTATPVNNTTISLGNETNTTNTATVTATPTPTPVTTTTVPTPTQTETETNTTTSSDTDTQSSPTATTPAETPTTTETPAADEQTETPTDSVTGTSTANTSTASS